MLLELSTFYFRPLSNVKTNLTTIKRMSCYLNNNFNGFLEGVKKMRSEHAPSSLKDYNFDERRSRSINGLKDDPKRNCRGVSFWMFRDQRIDDNWALICAQKFALQHKCPLYVTFYLMSHYSVAGIRQYDFMLRGLQQVEKQCRNLGIQFHLQLGYAKDLIDKYCEDNTIDLVVADFCPLRDPLDWVEAAGERLRDKNIPLYQVDAHNIIPTWFISNEQEIGCWTIRSKVHRHLSKFLTEFPAVEKHPYQPMSKSDAVDWDGAWKHLKVDESVKPADWLKPGTLNGFKMMHEFVTQRLKQYEDDRNEPTKNGTSNLSPYLHFGQLSLQRVILAVTDREIKAACGAKSTDHYVDEAVVRTQLADNFCFYNRNYDNFDGADDWAKKTHEKHRKDRRQYIYTEEQFQFAKTRDKLWNACQIQMVRDGKMAGYMRMYWAKKILEWTPSVEEAIRIACFLNDKYEYDGRDPNGYANIMWAMCGTHDRRRGQPERPVFGEVRYMGYNGIARQYDALGYISRFNSLK